MTQLAGILNLTPDSFSGDGVAATDALARVDAMLAAGAAIIDIGAESTRPGAVLLSPEAEWQRLSPVMGGLGTRVDKARFSIDTRHPATAQKALAAGFRIINDVSSPNPEMIKLARTQGAALIIMHSLTVPADPSRTLPEDQDPVEAVYSWAEEKLRELETARLPRAQVILDPGIGFGKTAEQSLALLKNIARFKKLGAAVMVGHSRKSFLSLFSSEPAATRDMETLIVSCWLAQQGIDYLRVHDIKAHATMLRIREQL